jgi:predicted KAP-like P-loop ATPase
MKKWIKRIFARAEEGAQSRVSPNNAQERAQAAPEQVPQDAPHAYSSDQPIRSQRDDRFNRFAFAKRIADTLAGRRDPTSIVIGLYGPWGDGKTSTLYLMEEALTRHDHVVAVRFNPWHFQSEQQLLKGFFATLAEALGKSLPTMKERIGRVFKDYGSLLSLASISIGGVVQVGAGDAARGLGEALSTVELDELRTRIEKLLSESGKRVVVLIDDIDRLDRGETQAIFKLVKLSAGFNHTSYVLAFDDEMVAAAIGEKYGQGGVEAGRSFLEKIIQVPLHLPPPDQMELRRMTFEGVNAALTLADITLSQEQVDAFVRHFDDGLLPQLETPRHAKLYVNALTFALPLLKGEAHVGSGNSDSGFPDILNT